MASTGLLCGICRRQGEACTLLYRALGASEGFWITHSLPGFPLPPGSSQSRFQGKLPGSPLQAPSTRFYRFSQLVEMHNSMASAHVLCILLGGSQAIRPAPAACTSQERSCSVHQEY